MQDKDYNITNMKTKNESSNESFIGAELTEEEKLKVKEAYMKYRKNKLAEKTESEKSENKQPLDEKE